MKRDGRFAVLSNGLAGACLGSISAVLITGSVTLPPLTLTLSMVSGAIGIAIYPGQIGRSLRCSACGLLFGSLMAEVVLIPILRHMNNYSFETDRRLMVLAPAIFGGATLGWLLQRWMKPLSWLSAGSFALLFLLSARLWMEDFPSLLGLWVFLIGSSVGIFLSNQRNLSFLVWFAVGGVTAAGGGYALTMNFSLPPGQMRILLCWVGIVGAVLALLMRPRRCTSEVAA